jgi:CTP-dependent riboflavin kinase
MKEIVHIIPLGHEIDRATKPFEKYKANRAYLLTTLDSDKYDKEMVEKQRYYLNSVKDQLDKLDITTHIINVDMFELLDVIKTVARIIIQEKSDANQVLVNVSSSGRLTSIGSTLAAMANGAQPYYVEADRYAENKEEKLKHGLSICQTLTIKFLEPFQFKLPKTNGIKLLVKLYENPKKKMKTVEAIEHLAEVGDEHWAEFKNFRSRKFPRAKKQKGLMKLNKGVLTELQKNGYIVREYVGRYNTIKITEAGTYIACISGMIKN